MREVGHDAKLEADLEAELADATAGVVDVAITDGGDAPVARAGGPAQPPQDSRSAMCCAPLSDAVGRSARTRLVKPSTYGYKYAPV
jgi:hypothetical protein